MYREYLTLNNLHWLIYHKTKPNQTKHKHKSHKQVGVLVV